VQQPYRHTYGQSHGEGDQPDLDGGCGELVAFYRHLPPLLQRAFAWRSGQHG
jgi:hypothetical protein